MPASSMARRRLSHASWRIRGVGHLALTKARSPDSTARTAARSRPASSTSPGDVTKSGSQIRRDTQADATGACTCIPGITTVAGSAASSGHADVTSVAMATRTQRSWRKFQNSRQCVSRGPRTTNSGPAPRCRSRACHRSRSNRPPSRTVSATSAGSAFAATAASRNNRPTNGNPPSLASDEINATASARRLTRISKDCCVK